VTICSACDEYILLNARKMETILFHIYDGWTRVYHIFLSVAKASYMSFWYGNIRMKTPMSFLCHLKIDIIFKVHIVFIRNHYFDLTVILNNNKNTKRNININISFIIIFFQ
jgi:hypothetical protein